MQDGHSGENCLHYAKDIRTIEADHGADIRLLERRGLTPIGPIPFASGGENMCRTPPLQMNCSDRKQGGR